jgi:hypothetical protein
MMRPKNRSGSYESRLIIMLPFTASRRLLGRELLAGSGMVSRTVRIGGAAVGVAGCAAMAAMPAGMAAAQTPSATATATATAAGGTRAAAAVVTTGPASSRAIVVTSLRSAGPGTLRWAINRADTRNSATIRFSVRGVITLTRRLPAIRRPVSIDGTSAPGHRPGGAPVIEINCNRRGGLRVAAGATGSQLLGLAVDRAGGNGVTVRARSVTLDGDYIGLNLAGAAAGNRGDGVYVTATSSGDQIGRNRSGVSGAVANVVSANGGSGVVLAGSHGNTVAANRIGTNAAGRAAMGNAGDGIAITGRSYGNEIGGTAFVDKATGKVNNPTGNKGTVTPVFVVPPLGNLVSGNGGSGILIAAGATGNMLNGNFVGTTASGDGAIGNAGDGVWIDGANGNSLIGCKFVNNPFVYYNVLSGNRGNGLRVTNANQTVVQGNFFGIGANNATTVANRGDGILVAGSSANTQVGGVIPLGNVSAGNGRNGIEVTGRARGFTTFNTFGGLAAFGGAVPNRRDGVLITSTGGDNLARTNVLSGNAGNGLEIGGNASGVTVDPDIVGLNTKGNAALPNGGDGVLIDGTAHGNVVGGSRRSVIPQNTFSGNGGYGLAITGRAYGNRVFSTFVGTAILGVKALPNRRGGVLVGGTAQRNSIGYLLARPANLISGNTGIGVTLTAGTHGNQVLNNYIGLNRLGRRLPNTGGPLLNRGTRNTILGNRY